MLNCDIAECGLLPTPHSAVSQSVDCWPKRYHSRTQRPTPATFSECIALVSSGPHFATPQTVALEFGNHILRCRKVWARKGHRLRYRRMWLNVQHTTFCGAANCGLLTLLVRNESRKGLEMPPSLTLDRPQVCLSSPHFPAVCFPRYRV